MPRSTSVTSGLNPQGSRAVLNLLRRPFTTAVVAGLLVLAFLFVDYDWQWSNVWTGANGRLVANGLLWTVVVCAISMVVGLVLGIGAAFGRMSRRLVPNHLANLYVDIVRGTPLLVQILIVVYCIGHLVGIDSKLILGAIALGVFSGAYVAEIVRAGIESVPRGQMEAARSLGMSHRQAMVHVIGPQALKNSLPALTGQFINLIKDSSLLSVVGFTELTKRHDQIYTATFASFEVYLPLAAFYLLLTLPLTKYTERLERRIGGGVRGHRI